MKDIISEIINNDNIVTLIGFCVTALIAYITARKTLSNNIKSINTEHFKNRGIEVQQRVLDTWCGVLSFDMETALQKYAKEKGLKNQKISTYEEKKKNTTRGVFNRKSGKRNRNYKKFTTRKLYLFIKKYNKSN